MTQNQIYTLTNPKTESLLGRSGGGDIGVKGERRRLPPNMLLLGDPYL